MIERKIVKQKIKEFQIEEHVSKSLPNSGHGKTTMQKTPLGEKIIIHASRPGLIVGRKGQNIKKLTTDLKKGFDLENPQIEIAEIENINMDAKVVAERIAIRSLERFGSQRFKGIAHRVLQDVMGSGALGVELVISGKIPSTRAKTWRFYQGYLKKCGDIALVGVNKSYSKAKLKSGIVGIQVRIMPNTTKRPDDIEISETPIVIEEEIKKEPKKKTKRKSAKKAKPKAERKKVKTDTKPEVVEEKKVETKEEPKTKEAKKE